MAEERENTFDKLLTETSFGRLLMGEVDSGTGSSAMCFHLALIVLKEALCATFVWLICSGALGALPSASNSCCRNSDAANLSLS